ncbi:MAG: hypothetical protein L3J25_11255 [Flavobacteriaceae bacterium]|nr:hypothetical protein [Flavobacteriaceae bacterium]
MGGEGSMSSAIVSLKNNRALLGRRKFKTVKNLIISKSGLTELEFKKVSPYKLEKIKQQIRLEARKRAKRNNLIFLIWLVSFGLILIYLFIL